MMGPSIFEDIVRQHALPRFHRDTFPSEALPEDRIARRNDQKMTSRSVSPVMLGTRENLYISQWQRARNYRWALRRREYFEGFGASMLWAKVQTPPDTLGVSLTSLAPLM